MDLHVLLVCPDQEPANLLTEILSEMGMEVIHTPSIPHGMELIDTEKYDAIVLDYRGDKASEEFLAHLGGSQQNKATMLIAVVDAEFNPRPIFGMGANFVLYRPLTSERTRLSMHAAKSLLQRERRRSPRGRVSSLANVSFPGGPDINATLLDISDGGTLVTTGKELPNSGKVYFEFSLPGQKQLVRLSGEVAWQDFSGRSGVRFLDVPQASRRLIQGWLQQNGGGLQEPELERHSERHHVVKSEAMTVIHEEPDAPEEQLENPEEPETPEKIHTKTHEFNVGNRRTEERLPCNVGAEVYRAGTTVPNRCTLSDISEGGCYVEMPSPLGGQSGVEILIRTNDRRFKLKGQVLASHPGFGMGVRFMFSDSSEREEILRLLAVLSGSAVDEQTN
jgi:CheY-like chemotaxis protein